MFLKLYIVNLFFINLTKQISLQNFKSEIKMDKTRLKRLKKMEVERVNGG